MIELKNVSFSYGADDAHRAIDGISLQVPDGTCTILCGRSGSGKSTVMRVVEGLAPGFFPGRREGSVHVAGKDPHAMSPSEKARLIGGVFQDPRSQFFMSLVRDEIVFAAENVGCDEDWARRRLASSAETFGVADLLDRRVDELSSGQKQRVAIAAASFLAPSALVLDEPTSNLDESGIEALVASVGRLKDQGIAILICDHRLHEYLPIADRYVHISEGRVAHEWTGEEFSALSCATLREWGLRHPGIGLPVVSSPGIVGVDRRPTALSPEVVGTHGLSLHSLTVAYDKSEPCVTDVSLAIPRATVCGVLGKNGVGKTTLAKVICGLRKQTSGVVEIGGNILDMARRRACCYMVMQDPDYQLYAESVACELAMGRNGRLSESIVTEALEAFGIEGLAQRHPASLSGGEKQRVTLAAAYCADSEIVLLDEPTSGLDADGLVAVSSWVRKLAERGKTVLVVTHDRLLCRLSCDETLRIEGRCAHLST